MEAGRIRRQWSKFREDLSSNTSIHGIVWTTGATSLLGRLIWGVIVLAAAGVLIYQIYDRATTYLSYPVSVDISVKIAQSLTFPAITVCNTNAFKISAAAENDLYEPLYNYYINGDSKGLPMSPSLEIKKKLAHKLKDFIFKCTFLNEDCTPKDDEPSSFEQIATDFGICYTFNGRNDPVRPKTDKYGNPAPGGGGLIRTITQTGAPYGLQLELNIEAYEAMPGPQGYGGIKILPHSPFSVPQISELGLSVPATRSAFVGLFAGTTIMLPSPWGHCAERPPNNTNYRIEEDFYIRNKAEYTKSRCEQNCYARLSADECKCSASFMPRVKGTPVCDIKTEEDCVVKTMKAAIKMESCSKTGSMDCPYQCNQTTYTAALTYGSLSEFELIRRSIKFQDESKPENARLLDQYQTAMGIRHQKVRALYITEQNLTEAISQELTDLMRDLDPKKTNKTSIKSLIDSWHTAVNEELNKSYPKVLEDLIVSFSKVRQSFGRDLSLYAVKSFVSEYEIDCKFAIKFLERKTNYVKQKTGSDKDFYKSFCSYYSSDLETAALTLENVLPDIQTKMQQKKSKIENEKDMNYKELWLVHYNKVDDGFTDAFTSLRKNLSRFRRIMNDEFCVEKSLKQLNNTHWYYYYKNDTERDWDKYKARRVLLAIDDILMDLTMKILNSDEGLSYQGRLAESLKISLNNFVNLATTGYDNANSSFYELLELCTPLQPVFQDLQNKFNLAGDPPPKKELMIKDIGVAMSTGLGTNKTDGFTEIFDNKMTSLKLNLIKLLEHLDEATEGIKDGVGRLNDEYSTTTLRAASAHLASLTTLKNHLTKVKESIRRNSEDLVRNLRDLLDRLSRDFEQRIKTIDDKFVQDNIVKISVYFTSMQTTSVSSKRAYEAFALICDFGGTAGLWLGASMISLIEVLYFLCKHIGLWYDNRDTPDDSEKNGQVNKMAEFSQVDLPGYSRPSDYADISSAQ